MWLSLLALAAGGAVDMVSVVLRQTILPLVTPDELRGRVTAVEMVFISASNELGAFESGVAAALIGAVPAVLLGGVLTIGVALTWTRLFPASSGRPARRAAPGRSGVLRPSGRRSGRHARGVGAGASDADGRDRVGSVAFWIASFDARARARPSRFDRLEARPPAAPRLTPAPRDGVEQLDRVESAGRRLRRPPERLRDLDEAARVGARVGVRLRGEHVGRLAVAEVARGLGLGDVVDPRGAAADVLLGGLDDSRPGIRSSRGCHAAGSRCACRRWHESW